MTDLCVAQLVKSPTGADVAMARAGCLFLAADVAIAPAVVAMAGEKWCSLVSVHFSAAATPRK
jgi:hypothetical protein